MKRIPPLLVERLKLPPCPIGGRGACCKGCLMGPCRVAGAAVRGVCGATRELIAARGILRMVAAGTAAHCGHAAHLLDYLGKELPPDHIRAKAPPYLQKAWKAAGVFPAIGPYGHFKNISEALHASAMGVGADCGELLKWCVKLGIVDGYYGMYAATGLEDGNFGKPEIREGKLNLACLSAEKTNIAVHGHEPAMLEALVKEARGDKDVNLVGVCCTGATFLSRYGIPLAAHFNLQEDVIATGLVEAMAVDSQCIMPSLMDLCECYHTRLITTSALARMPGALHLPITNRKDARASAKKIISIARLNRRNRKRAHEENFIKRAGAPARAVIGFTEDNIDLDRISAMLAGGEIKGVIAAVGCVNPRTDPAEWIEAFRKLGENHLILTTGCLAFELGKYGLLDGKRFFHLGSCVNNARIAEIFTRLAERAGKAISAMPFLVSCPMPVTEKSAAIGFFFAALGCDAHFGAPFPISSGTEAARILGGLVKNQCGGELLLETVPGDFFEKAERLLSRK